MPRESDKIEGRYAKSLTLQVNKISRCGWIRGARLENVLREECSLLRERTDR